MSKEIPINLGDKFLISEMLKDITSEELDQLLDEACIEGIIADSVKTAVQTERRARPYRGTPSVHRDDISRGI